MEQSLRLNQTISIPKALSPEYNFDMNGNYFYTKEHDKSSEAVYGYSRQSRYTKIPSEFVLRKLRNRPVTSLPFPYINRRRFSLNLQNQGQLSAQPYLRTIS